MELSTGDKDTHMPEMDYEKLSEAITEKTKVIVAVDIGGIAADYSKIYEVVQEKIFLN